MTSERSAEERAAQVEVARKIALDQLATRARSEQELRQVMQRRNVPADVADEIVERFTEVGLLNDAAFAQALTASRSEFSLRGRARIRQELQAKGIEREIANEVLADINPEVEREAALTLARRRMRSMAGLQRHVARRRMAGVLARRGFPSSVVSSVLEEVLGSDWQDESVEFSTGEQ
ncbi:MAG: regulatory protein RecX [Propionibacteriaceae bacterium]|nr:regulatory protein RecX [Propionibacteriaceae bacterium]